MESDWLAASSFERTHEIVAAINVLSIHFKLKVAGVVDPAPADHVDLARNQVLQFLSDLDRLLAESEKSDGEITGADPRWSQLTARFLAAKRSASRRSVLFATPLARLTVLLGGETKADLPELVAGLAELRALVELHARADTVGILGDR